MARWRTVGTGRRVRLEVTMLPPHPALPESAFAEAVTGLGSVLDLEVRELRVAETDADRA